MIVFLIIGVIAGWIAGKIMQDSGFDLGVDLFAGIAGSFIGGYLFRFLGVGVQETGNIDYVVNNRLGHYCPDPTSLRKAVQEISSRGNLMDSLSRKTSVKNQGSTQIAMELFEQSEQAYIKSA